MNLGSYFDYYTWSLEKQIDLYIEHSLDSFILRKIEGKGFLDYQEALPKVKFLLKYIKVGLFDPLTSPIDFDNEESIVELKKALAFAKAIKAKLLAIRIKPFDVNIEPKEVKTFFKKIKKITKRQKLVIILDKNIDMFVYNLIVNKIKPRKVSIIYNPASIYEVDYSPTTAYRLFKPKMSVIEVADLTDKKEPILVGYGDLELKDLFRRMYRDRFKGLVLLNSNLEDVFKDFGINKEMVNRRNKSKQRKKYLATIKKLGYLDKKDSEEISFERVLSHQIKLLKILFK